MIDAMAVPQEQQQSVLEMRKSPAAGKTKRTKRRSLTKQLLKPFASQDELDGSGRTVMSNGSEFFGSNNSDNNTVRLKSCVKKDKDAPKKQVSFDSIEVREHAIMLGDNPSVTSGPPLTIAWESHASYCASVDEYEKARPTRRSQEQMLIPRHFREEWLRHAGYARSYFAETEQIIQKVKQQRAASAQTSFISKVFSKNKGVK